MAIIERKQLTGSTAKINQYAGHEGQLVFDKTTKHLHVLSGTAGVNTKLANVSDIPAPVDISGKADTSYVETELAKKANTAHTHSVSDVNGLQSSLNGKANSSHTHAVSDVNDLQTALNTINDKIPKTGNRGAIAGYATSTSGATVDASAKDSQYTNSAVTVNNGASGQTWTKVVKLSAGTVTLGTNWSWVGGEAPELKYPCLLVCHWNQDKGIAGIVAGVA